MPAKSGRAGDDGLSVREVRFRNALIHLEAECPFRTPCRQEKPEPSSQIARTP